MARHYCNRLASVVDVPAMSRPLQRRNRKAPPQCRFEVRTVAELERIKALAAEYGYPDFRSFATDVFAAVAAADPLVGVVRFGHRFRALYGQSHESTEAHAA